MPGIDSFTKLMLHMDGADASTTFTDDSASPHTVTANGNAQIDTAQSKFGGASALFDGTGDYLSIPDHADWFFGTGDFTIDFWVRFASSTNQGMFEQYVDSANGVFASTDIPTGEMEVFMEVGNVDQVRMRAPGSFTLNTWHHIAFVRTAAERFIFYNGNKQILNANVNGTWADLAASFHIGTTNNGIYFDGWIDEFRVSKGVARWTNNFTPPTEAYSPNDEATPSALAITSSILVPTLSFDMTVPPSALAISANVLTPVILDSGTANPSPITISANLLTPITGTSVNITPSALAISASLLTPTIFSGTITTPSALAITATLQTPTISINGATLSAILPALTLSSTITQGMTMESTLPALTLSASCKSGQLLTMTGNLPVLTLTSHMGMYMAATLPALTLSSTLTTGGVMGLTSTLPALTLTASITSGRLLSLTTNLPALTLAANILNGNVLSLAQTLPALKLTGTGTTGNSPMSLTANLPVLTLTSTIRSEETYSLTATLPALKLEAFADNYTDRYI